MARRRRTSKRRRGGDSSHVLVVLFIGLLATGLWWINQQRQHPLTPTAHLQSDGQPIRIATWNLRKFSERARPDLLAIAELIKANQFDLIAIQEVQQQGQAVQNLRQQLGDPWCATISDPAGNGERFAFLYRGDRIEPTAEPRLLPSDTGPTLARTPYLGGFRAGQFGFLLLTVHLWYGDAGLNERRRQEVLSLAQTARTLLASSAEKDLIVLGDFNEFRRGGNLHYWQDLGWKQLILEPTNLSSTEIYDNLLIDPRPTREFAGTTGVIRFDEIRYQNNDKTASDDVSDHRPAYADFATDLPDDD
ncbi:MAG TPA: endonuclease/exonuclease/phosphatase family protein [Tepidisphaeraceae bacterium]|nr:endonuclease/exonuclease/phosphatase family protein [Tepidisphaeraceae bacterium]